MGGKGSKETLEDTIFNFRMGSKQLAKESQRSEQQCNIEKQKAAASLKKGMIDNARIYGENAIRFHNESLNYLRLSSKLDAVQSRLRSASRTQELTKQFGHVIPQMNSVLKSMNPEHIARTMNQFESVFENFEVVSGTINQSLETATVTSAPRSQVDEFLNQIASEHGIQVQAELGEVPLTQPVMPAQQVHEEQKVARYQ
eukprot:CAMPEP_0202944568 /NCGR_PEP_ID=MMETSP1395-20130829/5414_1 /ASSEMBLY_ACC=CAM_ASM_000871 /TAXON_ID=5961 /ORGANISM="Blepharisma japonicum, Strain Stock R1072" /LENGTH=199 /DNA_ID=CAMNT_0049643557 /DNA_START=25 /DNA_END=624 /DNA_ORIENTATION=+